MNEQEPKNTGRRDFDWGPPGNSFIEGVKEWLVYIFLLILLGMGIWFFVDISSRKNQAVRIAPVVKTENAGVKPENSVPGSVVSQNQSQKAGFLVQLGAFADRKTAETAIIALQNHGFTPKLSEPDSEIEIYRVSVGPFSSEEDAEKTVEKLNSLEFHSFVVECF